MTLEQKASYVSGHDMWTTEEFKELGVPAAFVSDGPHGLRKQELDMLVANQNEIYNSIDAVCFPTACATAASFDKKLMYDIGVTLGKECQAEDVSTILGPAINIKRSPLCGRNFEYVSEDPYLAGEMAASYVNGVQSQNVGTSVKHFAANSQETERMYADSVMDERTLREIYLTAFETVVKKAHPWTMMCSYNRINGTYASENDWLLNKVLRDEWGFDGLVMSDWGAVSQRVKGIAAGLDLEMPGSSGANDSLIVEAVKSGELSEEDLDKAVTNILKLVEKFTENRQKEVFDRDKDHEKAVRAEEECIVLLKNDIIVSGVTEITEDGELLGANVTEKGVLPLCGKEKIAVIGGFAANPRFQGGGSSHINSHEIVSAVSVMDRYVQDGGWIRYSEGFPFDDDVTDEAKFEEAVKLASEADKIVVFAGLPDVFESEGYDRSHMRLPDCQNELIDRLLELGRPVIVVLHNGSPVEMPWADYAAGIVEAYLGGEGVGEAVMNVLYGKVNPSGKLAESFPIKLEDNPSFLNFPVARHKVNYAEGVFVGYRYYDTKKMEVMFPFGYGLSYTQFEYSNLRVETSGKSSDDAVEIDINSGAKVYVDIKNVGDVKGKEVVQLYISDLTGATNRPVHELKGFDKIELEPGETKTVCFELDKRSFAWYSEEIGDWYAANGAYVIEIGKSSRDIVLEKEIELVGSFQLKPIIDQDVQLGELFVYDKTREYTKKTFAKAQTQFAGVEDESEVDEMTKAMLEYCPIRSLRAFNGMSNETINEILAELRKLV
ncbi:MAG: glycoside hydrolase family 3 C-terminal domain-containing protein [Eubacterium sp.]|nr:glycoside hydrolase family 3 C-terminal domain-containing protein [Eubacterium sp.]